MGTPLFDTAPRCVTDPPCAALARTPCWYCRLAAGEFDWLRPTPAAPPVLTTETMRAAGAVAILVVDAGTEAQRRVPPESGRPRRRTRGNR
jgi:hypothetical protein